MTLEEFVVKIGFQTDKSGIDKIGQNLDQVAKRASTAFSSVLGLVGKIGAVVSVWSVGKFAVQSAAQLERMAAQFEVMLGSAEKANAMVKDIQSLAASTPLTSLGITESVKTLLAFGVAGEDAIETVRRLGDVAGGDQERLSRLALAYGQTMSAGRLMGQDLLQYINVGFNPLKTIGDNLDKFGLKAGTTMLDLKKMMEAGKISAQMVTRAFGIATSEGGMFYQNMEKQSKTLGGLWSTMIDNIQINLVKAIEPLIPLMKELVDWVGKINWEPAVKTAQQLADVLLNGVIPAMQVLIETLQEVTVYLIPISILLLGAFGPKMWAMLLKTEIIMKSIAYTTAAYKTLLRVLGFEAAAQAGRQITANVMVANSWGYIQLAAVRAGAAMKIAMLGLLNPVTVVMVGLLGIWALYEKTKNIGEINGEDAKNDLTLISAYNRNRSERGLQALYAQRDAMEKHFNETGGLDGGKMATLREKIREAEMVKEDYVQRYERQFGRKPGENEYGVTAGGFDLTKMYQGITNNTKKVTNNFNNNITIPTTVDDKGKTPLSIEAVRSAADLAIRSAFNIKLLSIVEGA